MKRPKTRLLSQDTGEELCVGEVVEGNNKMWTLIGHYYKSPPSSGRVILREVGETRDEEFYPSVINAKIVLVNENKLTAKQVAKIATYCENVCQLFPSVPPDPDDREVTFEEASEMEEWEKMLMSLIDGDLDLPAYDDEEVVYWVEALTAYYEQYVE